MRRWDSTTMTIGLTVVVAIILGFSLHRTVNEELGYLGLPRQQLPPTGDARLLVQLPGWITALVDVLDATAESARSEVITAAQRPAVHVRLMDAPIRNLMNQPDPEAAQLRGRIEAVLTVPHPVIVADGYRPTNNGSSSGNIRTDTGLRIEIALKDGHWLLIESSLDPLPAVDPVAIEFSRALFAAWLVVSILLGIVLSFLAARRLVRPVSELTAAVEHLGGTADAPVVSPRGPREVRALIEAFNRMRERLRRFNEDRTRMIAAMSHDLRTPLTRLRLRTELVQDDNQHPPPPTSNRSRQPIGQNSGGQFWTPIEGQYSTPIDTKCYLSPGRDRRWRRRLAKLWPNFLHQRRTATNRRPDLFDRDLSPHVAPGLLARRGLAGDGGNRSHPRRVCMDSYLSRAANPTPSVAA
jgi:HAMP domain-containing protein